MTPIRFNGGFNVIYGDVESKEGKQNEHNLGKTSLVHLVDFLLLKTVTKKHFLAKYKSKFNDWVFYLEIDLGAGSYLTIRRSVETPTLVSFKTHVLPDQNFTELEEWDNKNVRMTSRKETDAPTTIENYLNFSVLQNYSARHFLCYLLRTQYDYTNPFKMSQFEGLDVDWKPQLFALLGYKEEEVFKKYRLQYEIKNYSQMLKTVLGNKKSSTRDSYNLKAAIAEKEKERAAILEQINKFDFYLREKKLNKELVEETEAKISKLNSERYRLDFEIKRIRESLENHVTFDLKEIEEVFEQTNIFFPEQLKKGYQDLLDFNTSLSNERAKYLKEDLKNNLGAIDTISSELKKLNQDKEEVLAFLRDTDTFSKYKAFQGEVFKLDEQLGQFRLKLQSLGTAENYEKKIEELKIESREVAVEVKKVIDGGSEIFENIKSIFKDIFKKTMGQTALLVVRPNQEGNPEFEVVTLDDKEEDQLTGQGDGYTATKVQCAALVLGILATYKKERFFKFAYHDGLVESWGVRPKLNFFKEIREFVKDNDIQYIISVIKSDIPTGFKFTDKEIVATLTHEKPLFGFSF
ncbi:MAG TPA: DUF2326 domain-containing protein [Candidatus Paceibacterota bacterium]|nr:DUF2326 domain-containing protein [Candidatus Paceibacterota bacterium]